MAQHFKSIYWIWQKGNRRIYEAVVHKATALFERITRAYFYFILIKGKYMGIKLAQQTQSKTLTFFRSKIYEKQNSVKNLARIHLKCIGIDILTIVSSYGIRRTLIYSF